MEIHNNDETSKSYDLACDQRSVRSGFSCIVSTIPSVPVGMTPS